MEIPAVKIPQRQSILVDYLVTIYKFSLRSQGFGLVSVIDFVSTLRVLEYAAYSRTLVYSCQEKVSDAAGRTLAKGEQGRRYPYVLF